jgi:hypothetical protein
LKLESALDGLRHRYGKGVISGQAAVGSKATADCPLPTAH